LAKDGFQNCLFNVINKSMQDQEVAKTTHIFAKNLTIFLLNDKEIEENTRALTKRVLKDEQVKLEMAEVCKWLMGRKEIKESMISLFSSSFKEEKFIEGLTLALNEGFTNILKDKETIEKIKLFLYYLIEEETKDEGTIRTFMDMILGKKTPASTSHAPEFPKIVK